MGCGTHHILSVIEYGKQLAEILDADADIVEIAALLHDYASVKEDQALYEEHHLHGPREAELLLQERGYSRATILAVKDILTNGTQYHWFIPPWLLQFCAYLPIEKNISMATLILRTFVPASQRGGAGTILS